jgi:hypothetical protein
MKIGISTIGYNSYDLLTKCYVSWQNLKQSYDIKICFSHGCFTETNQLGYPILSEDNTHVLAKQMTDDGIIDYYRLYDSPQLENNMWTQNFIDLRDKFDIDLLIMVNVDEIWETEEIKKMIEFIQTNRDTDYFKVNFKNYCINYNTWVDDFIVPRIWFVNKNEGLKRFYRDELVEYNNGKKDIQSIDRIISKDMVFPKHYSWVGSKEYLQRKLKFQQLRWGSCSYAWDYSADQLCLNDNYYTTYKITKPELHHDQI